MDWATVYLLGYLFVALPAGMFGLWRASRIPGKTID